MDVLSWAARLGRADQVRTIIQLTASDIDMLKKDKDFQTSLHHAVISGNIKAVQPIAETCSRYKLNIDVCDKHGLTPYLYARKLGYYDIAEMLAMVKASTLIFDAKSFKSAEEWAVEGARERMAQAKIKMRKQKMSRKIGGELIKTAQSKGIPTIIVTASNRKSYVVDLSKSKHFMGHSLKEFDDKNAHGLRPWERAADADAILTTSHRTTYQPNYLLTMNRMQSEPRIAEKPKLEIGNVDNDYRENRKFSSEKFNYLWHILSEQSTDAYRVPVKPPETPKLRSVSPRSSVDGDTSSLSVLPDKDGKSGKSSTKRAASRASRLGRAPSRVLPKKSEPSTMLKKGGRKNKSLFLPPIQSKA